MDRIYRRPKKPAYITTIARRLRRESTEGEQVLWEHLRGRRFMNLKFKRQKAVGRYIADFYCAEKSLIVEIDGLSHNGRERYDANRDAMLCSCGFTVIRVSNEQILADINSVLMDISERIVSSHTPFSHKWEKGRG